uniref:BRISC and BRCA1-A complex member 1 n=1 Tax=Chenopodium quinoa TaxID=63459 RepID=A0A803M9C1_CHEQI
MEFQVVEGSGSGGAAYTLKPSRYSNEDILLFIDVDNESMVEMKNTGPNGRPITRLDSIKQSILLFINAKLTINPNHRFAFASLSNSASWVVF